MLRLGRGRVLLRLLCHGLRSHWTASGATERTSTGAFDGRSYVGWWRASRAPQMARLASQPPLEPVARLPQGPRKASMQCQRHGAMTCRAIRYFVSIYTVSNGVVPSWMLGVLPSLTAVHHLPWWPCHHGTHRHGRPGPLALILPSQLTLQATDHSLTFSVVQMSFQVALRSVPVVSTSPVWAQSSFTSARIASLVSSEVVTPRSVVAQRSSILLTRSLTAVHAMLARLQRLSNLAFGTWQARPVRTARIE